jgi:hypothetical protein
MPVRGSALAVEQLRITKQDTMNKETFEVIESVVVE